MTVKFIVAKGENTQRLDLRPLRSITGTIDKLAFELRRSSQHALLFLLVALEATKELFLRQEG